MFRDNATAFRGLSHQHGAHPLRGRRCLVTGASGFIGSRLTSRLLELGAEVHGLARKIAPSPSCIWHALDLGEAEATRDLIAEVRPAIVFHLASHVVGARTLEAVAPTLRSNLLSTVNLLTALHALPGYRMVLASSLEVPDGASAELVPSSPYAAAKLASDAYARMFHMLYGSATVVARIFMVYGPGQRDRTKLVPHVVRSLLDGESPRLATGSREVDWTFVDDVVDGLLELGHTPGVEGQTIDLGSGELVQVRTVVERIAAMIDPSIPIFFGGLGDRPMEQVRVADRQRTERMLGGWRPAVGLEAGLQQTIEYYRVRPRVAGAM